MERLSARGTLCAMIPRVRFGHVYVTGDTVINAEAGIGTNPDGLNGVPVEAQFTYAHGRVQDIEVVPRFEGGDGIAAQSVK